MEFRKAKSSELAVVKALYASVIGSEGCTWNEYYPDDQTLRADHEAGMLYVLCDDGHVLGAVSVVPENELDGFGCWSYRGSCREIARVVVDRRCAGQGLAARMLTQLFAELKQEGCRAIHLSAACCNMAAVRTYEKLGFSFLDQCELYGNRYHLCEKLL